MAYSSFRAISMGRIRSVAKRIGWPEWLVQYVAVEYLPCRRLVEDDTWILFDFGLVKTRDIRPLALNLPVVILNDLTLFHNVTPEILTPRMTFALAGLPMSRLGKDSTTIPEGRVSPAHVPSVLNSPNVVDWKLSLNTHAVVLDSDGLYQWTVTSPAPHPSLSYRNWFQSSVFSMKQLNDLRKIHDEVYSIISPEAYPIRRTAIVAKRKRLEQLYLRLEVVRASMRSSVLAYHARAKSSPEARAGYSEDPPPMLTLFDELKVEEGKLKVRSYVEALFFHSANTAAVRAEQARARPASAGPGAIRLQDEIEAAAECIILCAMCLEAFINGFAKDKLPQLSSSLERIEVKSKWLIMPGLLGKSDCFRSDAMPFQSFTKLVGWRNELVHHKHDFHLPKQLKGIGNVTQLYSICNAENARTAVDTVRQMVQTLCSCVAMAIPPWAITP